MQDHDTERLIPAPEFRRRMGGISPMTEHRWRKAGILPEPIRIQRRCYYPDGIVAEVVAKHREGAK